MIYLIRIEGTQNVKIGHTTNEDGLARRMKAASTWNPRPVKVIGTLGGNTHLEAGIHDWLVSYHIKGEWFSLPESIIAQLCDPEWVVATIPPSKYKQSRLRRSQAGSSMRDPRVIEDCRADPDHPMLSQEQLDQIERDSTTSLKSYTEIASEVGCSVATVSRLAHLSQSERITEAVLRVWEAHPDWSYGKVARHLDLDRSTVTKRIQEVEVER